jgi:hypothetical protein
MSPHFVAPYRKNQKNDGNDADAIGEAVGDLRCCWWRRRMQLRRRISVEVG